ncbi:MAG: hypothetical protein CSA38_02505 [Flavobacteriales bacterium]|nr:MAG: hypothetical protein CSA38_02505 [Flavobacteriales bacterium]
MTALSITFHCTAPQLENWEKYLHNEFLSNIKKMEHIQRYIFSEVYSEMIEEGKNYNLLVLFDNEENRAIFMEEKLGLMAGKITDIFANEVMIFPTLLNPIKSEL